MFLISRLTARQVCVIGAMCRPTRLHEQQTTEVVEGRSAIRVLFTEHLLIDGQDLLVVRLGLVQLALRNAQPQQQRFLSVAQLRAKCVLLGPWVDQRA